MKKQIIALSVALIATVSSSFAQGYVSVSTVNNFVWDEFTTAGSGVKANTDVNYAIYWAPAATSDPLSAVGTQFPNGATQSVATNQVTSISGAGGLGNGSINTTMTGAGFTLALLNGGSTVVSGTTGAGGNIAMGQIQIAGMTGGTTYELVVVGWNATAGGASALTGGTYTAIGWSNPFNYTPGTASGDSSGLTALSTAGMVKFGVAPVAPVPEPGTMALAALGGASLLLFRRRK